MMIPHAVIVGLNPPKPSFRRYLLSTTPASMLAPMKITQMAELCAQLGVIKAVWDRVPKSNG